MTDDDHRAPDTAATSTDDGSYTGHVEPQGAPAHRELTDISITKLSVGAMDNNAYLLVCKHTGDGVLIDAANDADRIATLVEQVTGGSTLQTIITTHSHYDHWQALAEVAKGSGAQVLAGAADAAGLPVPVDLELANGDSLPSATAGSTSSPCAGTRRDPSPCCTGIRRGWHTCSPVTHSSPADRARPGTRRPSPR